ncbi:MAG: SdrD B-like domain-containing protein [Eubacteriales bacterium]
MPKILSQVDLESGNYEDAFVYTINASFNGIEGNIESAKIEIAIPSYFTVYLGDIEKPIQEVTERILNDDIIYTFDLGSIEDLGLSLRFGLGLVFQTSMPSGSTYTMTPKMIINGELVAQYETSPITLLVSPRFVLSRERVLPLINPAPMGTVFYKVTLTNFGDLGSTINTIEIQCSGTSEFIIDSTFPIVGKDITTGNFMDKQADGITGTVTNNQAVFSIPKYSGEKYQFIYRGIISEESFIGSEIDTVAKWSIDTIEQKEDLDTLLLQAPLSDASISVYGPDYTLPNEKILYQLNFKNNGNQIIENCNYNFNLPKDVIITSFSTGIFHISEINELLNTEYEIFYSSINGKTGSLGIYNTNINSQIDLTTILEIGDALSSVSWNLNTLGIGVKDKVSPTFMGQVVDTATIGDTLLSRFQLGWQNSGQLEERIGNQSAVIENICVLRPLLSQSTNGIPVKPGTVFTYTLGANCVNSRLNTPIFALLLPPQLEYRGNESIYYTEPFTTKESPMLPPAIVIPNFLESGETLVVYKFIEEYAFNLVQRSFLFINIDVAVTIGAKGDFQLHTLLNTIESKSEVPNAISIYEDNNNMAADTSVNRFYAKSAATSNYILFFVSTISNKKVKGSLDTDYIEEPFIGNTLAGDVIDYKITIENIGNADLESIEIVDIFPYIDDIGIIEIKTPRASQFQVYPASHILVSIKDIDGTLVSTDQVALYYSQSKDPVRFSNDFGIIGVDDDWSETPPEDITTVSGIKISTINTKLLPAQILELNMKAIIPVQTPTNYVAWNSFAADITYLDNQNKLTHLLAIEPEKVGIQVMDNPIDTGSITGFVFLDHNGNGHYEETEQKLNDVGVVLYHENGIPLRATFTTTTYDNLDGYYYFGNIPTGNYFLKFFIDDHHYKFTTKRLDIPLGSTVDPKTCLTPLISVSANETINTYHAGIIPKDFYTIDTILEVNRNARSMLKNVIYDQMLIGMKMEDVTSII